MAWNFGNYADYSSYAPPAAQDDALVKQIIAQQQASAQLEAQQLARQQEVRPFNNDMGVSDRPDFAPQPLPAPAPVQAAPAPIQAPYVPQTPVSASLQGWGGYMGQTAPATVQEAEALYANNLNTNSFLTGGYDPGLMGKIGNALPGLVGLKDIDYPYIRSDIAIVNGVATQRGSASLDYKKGDALGKKDADQLGQFAIDRANQLLQENGLYGKEGVNFQLDIGSASGRKNSKLGTGLFVGEGGVFASGSTYTGLSSMSELGSQLDRYIVDTIADKGYGEISNIPQYAENNFIPKHGAGSFDNTSVVGRFLLNAAAAVAGGWALSTMGAAVPAGTVAAPGAVTVGGGTAVGTGLAGASSVLPTIGVIAPSVSGLSTLAPALTGALAGGGASLATGIGSGGSLVNSGLPEVVTTGVQTGGAISPALVSGGISALPSAFNGITAPSIPNIAPEAPTLNDPAIEEVTVTGQVPTEPVIDPVTTSGGLTNGANEVLTDIDIPTIEEVTVTGNPNDVSGPFVSDPTLPAGVTGGGVSVPDVGSPSIPDAVADTVNSVDPTEQPWWQKLGYQDASRAMQVLGLASSALAGGNDLDGGGGGGTPYVAPDWVNGNLPTPKAPGSTYTPAPVGEWDYGISAQQQANLIAAGVQSPVNWAAKNHKWKQDQALSQQGIAAAPQQPIETPQERLQRIISLQQTQ